ncbi:uncharacterized protein LOC143750717 [Siphateles boraxobius]|uniref:uncharacterized protein LOC143750717 n=1 Tax=Siphateles boraxobius TaxID=180520 RepID=UPI004064AE1D
MIKIVVLLSIIDIAQRLPSCNLTSATPIMTDLLLPMMFYWEKFTTLACLPKIYQKAHVNFLHIKEQVPVTIQTLRSIKEPGQTPLPGSFLSRFHQDLDDLHGLGAFNIQHEEERNRRGRDVHEVSREELWAKFQREVIHPYITGLETHLERRFHDLGAFSVLGPLGRATPEDDIIKISQMQTLARKICPQHENEVLQEWFSFKNHVLTGSSKVGVLKYF